VDNFWYYVLLIGAVMLIIGLLVVFDPILIEGGLKIPFPDCIRDNFAWFLGIGFVICIIAEEICRNTRGK
jgi:hypothetical protein